MRPSKHQSFRISDVPSSGNFFCLMFTKIQCRNIVVSTSDQNLCIDVKKMTKMQLNSGFIFVKYHQHSFGTNEYVINLSRQKKTTAIIIKVSVIYRLLFPLLKKIIFHIKIPKNSKLIDKVHESLHSLLICFEIELKVI